MELLIFAIGVAIICYIGFAMLFPKAVKDPMLLHTDHVLDELYSNTRTIRGDATEDQVELLRRGTKFEDASPFTRSFYHLPGMRKLYARALQAGMAQHIDAVPFIVMSIIFLLCAAILFFNLPFMLIFIAPLIGYWVVLNHFAGKIRKRNAKFLERFPDVLDMMVRSVRSGFPVSTAIQMVADNMEPPVSNEFQQVADELALGRSLTDALKRLGARINESDIQFFIVVLAVQQETGGNLAEVMSNLSNIIRKRKQLRQKVQAMTAEGRLTAWVLGALPALVFMVLYLTQKEYLAPLWETSIGNVLFGVSISLVVLAIYSIRRMVDMEV